MLDTEVWSCSITGKSQLTFEEAVESENESLKLLKKLDKRLVRGVLYLISKAKYRTKLSKLEVEIWNAMKDRLFLGLLVNEGLTA